MFVDVWWSGRSLLGCDGKETPDRERAGVVIPASERHARVLIGEGGISRERPRKGRAVSVSQYARDRRRGEALPCKKPRHPIIVREHNGIEWCAREVLGRQSLDAREETREYDALGRGRGEGGLRAQRIGR